MVEEFVLAVINVLLNFGIYAMCAAGRMIYYRIKCRIIKAEQIE